MPSPFVQPLAICAAETAARVAVFCKFLCVKYKRPTSIDKNVAAMNATIETPTQIATAPHMVGGTGRDVTTFMEAMPGLIAKDGAESVYAAGLADGRGVAVKVADGAPFSRARRGLLAQALLTLGVDTPGLRDLANQPVLGHGRPVGAVEVLDLRTP